MVNNTQIYKYYKKLQNLELAKQTNANLHLLHLQIVSFLVKCILELTEEDMPVV